MTKHEQKLCPRCNIQFECKVGSIDLCQCNTIVLDEGEKSFIKEHYDDCLCAPCMKIMKAECKNQVYIQKLKSILGVYYKKG